MSGVDDVPSVPPTGAERFARVAYVALWWFATPLIAAYLLWRSRRQPAYRRDWGQRFLGRYRPRRTGSCVWIHAVSVGETRAAAPLVERLRRDHPARPILVTHMTPTGRETAEALFGASVEHAYLAYDYPHAVTAFFRHWRPVVGIVMETEIWPSLLVAAERAGTPMILANARLSAKSLVAARRWPALMRPALRRFRRVLAQTDGDAQRFAILGDVEFADVAVSRIATVGNVKFDVEPPDAQRVLADRFRSLVVPAAPGRRRPVFLCASTREGEEERILDAWMRHDGASAGVLLAIVPRHPQRFDAVVDLAVARGLPVVRRSDERPVGADIQVWVGDSMGELWAWYLAADCAYVGGSIPPLGGQNLIEAAAAGCPVLIGRNTFNFAAASDEAVRTGSALRVDDYDALVVEALRLVADPDRCRRIGEAGRRFAAAHRGATDRTVAIIEGILRSDGTAAAISRS